LIRPGRRRPHSGRMDLVAVALALLVFAALLALIAVLDRV
jgi:hypothetical protein